VSKRNVILLAAVAVLGVGAFWQLVLSPKRAELTKLDAQISKQETARDQANAQATQYEKAKSTYEANYAKVVQLGKAVPADDDVRSLLVQLEDSAHRQDVDFRLISVGSGGSAPTGAGAVTGDETTTLPGGQTVPGSDITMLPFSFGFKGRFFDLADFMRKVEQYVTVRNSKTDATGRLLLLTSFTVKPDVTGLPNLRAEVGATSYATPPTTALPGDAAPSAKSGDTTPAPSSSSTPPTTTATATGAVR